MIALGSVLLVACGTAAPPAPSEMATAPPEPISQATTPTPEPTAQTSQAQSAKDTVILVTSAEPGSLDAWDTHCNATLDTTICNELANEPFTWITSDSFEVVPLSGVEGWEQLDPDRWRFTLRQGVKFHNGEPWNASSAKAGIDQNGTEVNPKFNLGSEQ